MISKTFKIGLFVITLCSVTFVNAQERREKKHGNPKELFKKLDADTNGSLSLEEFKSKRIRDEAKSEIIDERFKTLDANGDGALSIEEFLARKEMTKEERIEQRFAKLDTDGNGTIDLAEYKAFVANAERPRKKRKRRRH